MPVVPSEISYIVIEPKMPNTSRSQGLTSVSITAPAREALEYEKQVFHSSVDGNPFAGPPRPELDAAWHDLLKSSHRFQQMFSSRDPITDGHQ